VNLPLVDYLSGLQVHPVERIGVIRVLENHVLILLVKHDFVGCEGLALWCHDIRDRSGELQLVVRGMFEHTDLVSTNHERSIMLVADC
jgi:hypothetical protein